jgi:hypothetical protein
MAELELSPQPLARLDEELCHRLLELGLLIAV